MISKYGKAFSTVMPKSSKKFVIDQFTSSEFFNDGSELRDYQVFARANANPELKEKLREYMLEQEVKNFDGSVSDEQIEQSIVSKYDSVTNILRRVTSRIHELRSHPQDSDDAAQPDTVEE